MGAVMFVGQTENPITRLEMGDLLAGGFDDTGKVNSQYCVPRSPQSGHQPTEQRRLRSQRAAIGATDRRRLHLDQQLVVARLRYRHLAERQHIRRTVAGIDNSLQCEALVGGRGNGCRLITLFLLARFNQ